MKNMVKKLAVVLCAALCMLLSGCNNEFARDEYNDSAKIASSSNRYAKEEFVINTNDSGFTLESGSFDGRETVWEYKTDSDGELNLNASMELNDGHAKLVLVDADKNIMTLAELPENKTDSLMDPVGVVLEGAIVNVKKGKNSFKLVGYGAKDVKLELSIGK